MSDDRIAQIVAEARAEIAQCNSADQIESLRVKYLGSKSAVVAVLRGLKDLDGEQRKAAGQQANEAKEQIERCLQIACNRLVAPNPAECWPRLHSARASAIPRASFI